MKIRKRKTAAALILMAGVLLASGCGAKKAAAGTSTGAAAEPSSKTQTETSAEPSEKTQTETSAEPVDAVSSASQVFYEDSSLDREQLWAAIGERKGGCTIATVNEDGTPNLIVAVPAAAGEDHIYFTWADNVSRANAQRTGKAMVSYYIYDADAESKVERNIGARMRLELERDEAVLAKLAEADPTVKAGTVFKVVEILPLG